MLFCKCRSSYTAGYATTNDFLLFLLAKVCLYFQWGRLSMLFMCVRLFMIFIRESLFVSLTKEGLFTLFKFTGTGCKS
jgi:hypothetical protein